MNRLIFIYVDIWEEEIIRRYRYNIASVDENTYNQIEEYVRFFNRLSRELQDEEGEDWIKIEFVLSKKLLKAEKKDDFSREFSDFFNTSQDHLDEIDILVMGWNKKIVDDIFQMDKIRPLINYTIWEQILSVFSNPNGVAEAFNIHFRLDQDQIIDILANDIHPILLRMPDGIQLLNLNQQYDIYNANDYQTEIFRNDSYDRPPTYLSRPFWENVLEYATDKELETFSIIPDQLLNSLVYAEISRRTNNQSVSPLVL